MLDEMIEEKIHVVSQLRHSNETTRHTAFLLLHRPSKRPNSFNPHQCVSDSHLPTKATIARRAKRRRVMLAAFSLAFPQSWSDLSRDWEGATN